MTAGVGSAKVASSGLADRNGWPAIGGTAIAGYGPSTGVQLNVVVINWADIQPGGQGTALTGSGVGAAAIGTAAIDQAVTWAKANGGKLKIRIFCGRAAPSSVASIATGNTLSNGQDVAPVVYCDGVNSVGVGPPFWMSTWRTAAKDLFAKLAAYQPNGGHNTLDTEPTIVSIQISGSGTIFEEPCFRQMRETTVSPNNVNMLAIIWLILGGYTSALDQTQLLGHMDDVIGLFPNTRVAFAFNPFDNLDQFTAQGSIASNTTTSIVLPDNSLPAAGTYTTTANRHSACIVYRYNGRTTADGTGTATLTDANAGFVVAGVQKRVNSIGVTTFDATHANDPSGAFVAAQVGMQVAAGASTANVVGIASGTSLIVDAWVGGTPVGGTAFRLVGDTVWLAGTSYEVTAVPSATTLTLASNIGLGAYTVGPGTPSTLSGYAYLIVPSSCPVVGLAVSNNTTGVGNAITVAGAPGAGALNGFKCVVARTHTQNSSIGDETITATFITHARAQAGTRIEVGNNSVKADTSLSQQNYADMLAAGPPFYFQTGADTNINGGNAGTSNPLLDTLANINGSGFTPSYVELPNGYAVQGGTVPGGPLPTSSSKYSGTTTAIASGGNLVVTDSALPAGTNAWGNGNGKLGIVTFTASGNSYFVTSNTGTTFTVTVALAAQDQASGLAYVLTKWDHIEPAALQAQQQTVAGLAPVHGGQAVLLGGKGPRFC